MGILSTSRFHEEVIELPVLPVQDAILSEHGLPGEGIFQKNFQWFFQSKDYGVIPFFSGMRIA